jgi:hypothetical protein
MVINSNPEEDNRVDYGGNPTACKQDGKRHQDKHGGRV